MSIYCSTFSVGGEHKPRCAKITKDGPKSYIWDDSKPCTCGASPLVYQGSHVLPSNKDKRGGQIGFARVATHITRSGRRDGIKPHPWLRFHMYANNQNSLILTRKQVEEFRDAMTDWLDSL